MSSAPSASASGSGSGSGSASSKSLKRLSREYTTLQQQPLPYATVALVDDQLTTWHANIKGPSGSPYENGVFKLQLHFPDAYPNKPPEINFVTPIYHLNVSMRTGGSICQDIVSKDWSPVLRVSDLLFRIQIMLLTPHAESPLEADIGEMYHKQPHKYKETAKAWTKKHAQ